MQRLERTFYVSQISLEVLIANVLIDTFSQSSRDVQDVVSWFVMVPMELGKGSVVRGFFFSGKLLVDMFSLKGRHYVVDIFVGIEYSFGLHRSAN